jgi:hypothetical protein
MSLPTVANSVASGKLIWQQDALLYSSSNAEHGRPRTNADKRKAVRLLLADAEWGQWSDREIARHCQVSQWFVSRLRKGASHNGYEMKPRKVSIITSPGFCRAMPNLAPCE